MSDLIKYDKECNYIDLRKQDSSKMINQCIKENLDITDTCNLKNSELNSINEETMKNMNSNIYNNMIDNNLLNISDTALINSLNLNKANINIALNLNKNYKLNIYPKKIENDIFSIALNETGNEIIGDNKVDELFSDKNNNKFDIINKRETTLIEENLNNINNGNDITKFNNKSQNVDILNLYGVSNTSLGIEELLNENLQ